MAIMIPTIEQMCEKARKVQDEKLTERERQDALLRLRIEYNAWCVKVRGFDNDDFRKEYKGNFLSPGIEAFFERGWMLYAHYKPGGIFPRWVINVEKAFVNRIMVQSMIVRR